MPADAARTTRALFPRTARPGPLRAAAGAPRNRTVRAEGRAGRGELALGVLVAAVIVLLAPAVGRANQVPVPAARTNQVPDAATRAKAHYELGMTAYGLGHYDRAVLAFTEAYQVDPAPILLYNIAQAYWKKGDRERANTYYRRYLEADPRARNRAQIRARIRALEADLRKNPSPPEAAHASDPAPPPEPGLPAEPAGPPPGPSGSAAGPWARPAPTAEPAPAPTGPPPAPASSAAGPWARPVPPGEAAPDADATSTAGGAAAPSAGEAPAPAEASRLAEAPGGRSAAPAGENGAPAAAARPPAEPAPPVAPSEPAPNGAGTAAGPWARASNEPQRDPALPRLDPVMPPPLPADVFSAAPPGDPPIYRRPWFWPALGAVGLVTVATIFLVRPDGRSWSCGAACLSTREVP
jgi:hypothetical protein